MGLERTVGSHLGARHNEMIPSFGQLSGPWPLGRYIRGTKPGCYEWFSELLCLLGDCKTKDDRPDGKGLQATTWIII